MIVLKTLQNIDGRVMKASKKRVTVVNARKHKAYNKFHVMINWEMFLDLINVSEIRIALLNSRLKMEIS